MFQEKPAAPAEPMPQAGTDDALKPAASSPSASPVAEAASPSPDRRASHSPSPPAPRESFDREEDGAVSDTEMKDAIAGNDKMGVVAPDSKKKRSLSMSPSRSRSPPPPSFDVVTKASPSSLDGEGGNADADVKMDGGVDNGGCSLSC